jgi:DHA1 family bicyclomycin/chloramphenicol resistance-like MFS transporter
MSAAGSVPMTAGAIYQRAVAVLYDGQSALSMTVVMVLRSLLAIVSYLPVVRPAECRQ